MATLVMPPAGKEQLPLLSAQRVTIVHQELRPPKKSFVGIQNVAEDLEHPRLVGINANATNVDDTCLSSMTKNTICLTVPNAPSVSTLKKSQA